MSTMTTTSTGPQRAAALTDTTANPRTAPVVQAAALIASASPVLAIAVWSVVRFL